ncbi:hypothetical protein SSAG_05632 [Streptomyces sp. Mg1]|nr:hypothetical protein SSAG_05632 [Streptomyces sp. Mg1]
MRARSPVNRTRPSPPLHTGSPCRNGPARRPAGLPCPQGWARHGRVGRMDDEEDMRLARMTPEISRRTLAMLRGLAGMEPPEQVPEEAMLVADAILAEHGTDGLRVLVMTLAAWATAQIENVAELSRRSHEAVLDAMELACLEANAED